MFLSASEGNRECEGKFIAGLASAAAWQLSARDAAALVQACIA
jgi:hypothetical protein